MSSPKKIVVPEWMRPMYDAHHFAPAVIDGDHLRCSGMMGIRPDMTVPAEPRAQFTLAFENLRGLLAEAGLTFANVTDMTSYHVGLRQHVQMFGEVKDEFVAAPYPAWTAVGVTELAMPGALVEIQIIARMR
ncbi:enamine deaminase RidA (YjgF/YER057c/UK114 family) [Mycobacterium frederiksbergense]|uniref:Enamine deaminase RidA (YjgF/YER057c/UK114 family) n=1 Tax=Mycolicibacterium frederiksbergense TaxID=117567 RepID=A0ABT6KYI8_9MYCO|nr:RidA family protein [Mycolicibacterium frederiksbergense]MDH6195758.1 enamine deaminase RidA (YjgF/YER057c/UK114 family) [Mycolicibacterium frederiksbergense]